jgi:hypothetical protein
MFIKKLVPSVFWILLLSFSFSIKETKAQAKRYKEEVFKEIDSITNITYGEAINIKGEKETLLLDIIMPKNDSVNKRPLVIFIHGGGFKSKSKNGIFSSMLCNSFARKGYVSATIDYRLGVEKSGIDSGKKVSTNGDYAEALYRAQHDGKAAIRFFRRYAKKYGIDDTQIFITGTSAGSKTCLAIAYMDDDEVPKEVNKKRWGTLEGNSGNDGFSSKVQGVMNNWGAMIDYSWIKKGDAPLYNTAGTEDKTVPYDSSFDYHGFKYGPYILYQHCRTLGIPTGWRPFYGAGHTLNNKKEKQDSCIQSMAAWLYTQLKFNNGKEELGVLKWEMEMARFESLNKAEKYYSYAIMFIVSAYISMRKNISDEIGFTKIIHRSYGGRNLIGKIEKRKESEFLFWSNFYTTAVLTISVSQKLKEA